MRSLLSGLCGLVALVLLPLALVLVWLHTEVADSEAYLQRIDPLASQAQVRSAAERVLEAELLHQLDLTAVGSALQDAAGGIQLPGELVDKLPGGLADKLPGLADELGPLAKRATQDATGAAEQLVGEVVHEVVHSPVFVTFWHSAQQTVHSQTLEVLSSTGTGGLDRQIVLPLDPFVRSVSDQLGALGVQLQQQLDGMQLVLPLTDTPALRAARSAFALLESVWLWLPVAAAAAAVLAVLAARRRLRALGWLGLLGAAVLLVLLLALAATRAFGLAAVGGPDEELIARRMFDALTADLRREALWGAAVLGVVGLTAAVAGRLTGRRREAIHGRGDEMDRNAPRATRSAA